MFRKIITVATLVLVVLVIWSVRDNIAQAFGYLANTNLLFVLLLIPEQILLYYCSGQIFFSYLTAKITNRSARQAKQFSPWFLARVSFELNFVNQAVPSGGFAGLSYVAWRLRPLGSSVGQTSFMYALRYVITILTNQLQTALALLALILLGGISDSAWWVIGLTGLACAGIILGLIIIVVIASSRKRISWFTSLITKIINSTVKIATFGHKRQLLSHATIEKHFDDIHRDLTTARQNKRILVRPILWGIVYSFLEVGAYWLVSIGMGHPEILPHIIVAGAIASVVGIILMTPGGLGGYEGAMIFVLSALGVETGLATAVVITTRVIVLLGTLSGGYIFYQNAVSKIGKAERAQIMSKGNK